MTVMNSGKTALKFGSLKPNKSIVLYEIRYLQYSVVKIFMDDVTLHILMQIGYSMPFNAAEYAYIYLHHF
jgi:hypothetical protein